MNGYAPYLPILPEFAALSLLMKVIGVANAWYVVNQAGNTTLVLAVPVNNTVVKLGVLILTLLAGITPLAPDSAVTDTVV